MNFKEMQYMIEGLQARNERTVKRLIAVVIITIALLFISNAIWLWAWSSYDYASSENSVDLSTDGGGDANFIGNDGNITNGEDKSSTESTQTNQEKR